MKDQLIFDTTETADSDNVGAYLRSSDGTLLTHTTIGGAEALDVNVAQATGLAIYAEDSAHTSGDDGQFMLAVRHDASTSLVDTDGDYAPLQVDDTGRLKVAMEVTVNAGDAEFLEDTPHTSGDAGIHILSVRNDAGGSLTSADGDYASLQTNDQGRLWVEIGNTNVDVQDLADTAILADANSITTTSGAILPAELANRKFLNIYNNGNKKVFVGQSGVTTSDGFPISPGAYMELRAGANITVHGVTTAGSQNVRTLELS